MSEISEQVKNKIAEVIELWADETLDGKPAILANATYYSMVKFLQDKTDEINATFGPKVEVHDNRPSLAPDAATR